MIELAEPVLEKDVTDYDFLFSSGVKLPLTLDFEAGDKVEEDTDRFILTLASKPNALDPEKTLAKETVSVYKCNIVALVVRERKQRMPTPEEQFHMRKTISNLVKTVQ